MGDWVVNEIVRGDCQTVLQAFPDEHFSACITDPPYGYEFIGCTWDEKEIKRRLERVKKSTTLVKNIPYGSGRAGGVRNARWYERNRKQVLDYTDWCRQWGRQVFRTLKVGAYLLVFSSTRSVAHVQVAMEEAGFYARDLLVYRRRAGIPKGWKVGKGKEGLGCDDWQGWHSCLRNEWEAICLLQKPLVDNYAKTLAQSGVGLLHAQPQPGGAFQSNVLEGFLRDSTTAGDIHCTVKPLELMKFLVQLTVPASSKHIVLDPFCGTGTTCLAAKQHGCGYLGIEVSSNYCEFARKRLAETVS